MSIQFHITFAISKVTTQVLILFWSYLLVWITSMIPDITNFDSM